ncbi:uncharacterized protein LOC118402921 [Oncorhynchus keta]|uniref:uncharacterized protein LOC118402921 n=1 Tax=Oncorhynchus keta TaxID=8018 RepID=UPI00227C1A6B|nr:uncharacterized protein LOC118402921 [Oncorhynchus keta]
MEEHCTRTSTASLTLVSPTVTWPTTYSPLLLSPVTAASPAQSHTHPEKGQQSLLAPVLVSLSVALTPAPMGAHEGLNDIHRGGIWGNGGSVWVPVRGRGPGHLQSIQPIHCQRVKGQTDPSTLQSQTRCQLPIGQEAGQLLRPQQALQGRVNHQAASLRETVTKVPPDPPTSIREHTPSSLAASELDDTLIRAGPGDCGRSVWFEIQPYRQFQFLCVEDRHLVAPSANQHIFPRPDHFSSCTRRRTSELSPSLNNSTSRLHSRENWKNNSFAFLATAIGSDYWYIIEVNRTNRTDTDVSDSHSGLWITYEGQKVYSYTFNSPNYSEPEMHMLNMHSAIVVLLPLSLVLLVFGGICGLISSLARSPTLLTGTASYLILCSVLTLSGVSLYISYSQQAMAETERLVGAERLAQVVSTSFGWSLGLAWLSFCLEVLAGLLLLLAARLATLQHGPQGHGWPLHVVT